MHLDWRINSKIFYHRPPTKLQEGNVFSLVCLSFCSQDSPHMTTTDDAFGQSQMMWGLLSSSLGSPPPFHIGTTSPTPQFRGFLHLSLSQSICLNLTSGMLLCMIFLCSKFNKDNNYLVLLEMWLDIVLFKKFAHKCFCWGWARHLWNSLAQASTKIWNVYSSLFP